MKGRVKKDKSGFETHLSNYDGFNRLYGDCFEN
jgi:hypothetical protein